MRLLKSLSNLKKLSEMCTTFYVGLIVQCEVL